MMKKFKLISTALSLSIVIVGCSNGTVDQSESELETSEESQLKDQDQLTKEEYEEKVFNIDVKESQLMLNDEISMDAWTYNGTLPGEEIRVKEGDKVMVNVKNYLDV